MAQDPRDEGQRGRKEWEEFRASYASARIFSWLIAELEEIAPGYADDLRRRIAEGILSGEQLAKEDPEYDGAAIIHSPVLKHATFLDLDDAQLLEDQLFPHPGGTDPRDFVQAIRGLAVVAFHCALETYALGVGVSLGSRMTFPQGVVAFLSAKGPLHGLSSLTADELTTLDELRHLIVHHRGIVSARYIANVKYSTYQIGELRAISEAEVETFAHTIYRVALRIAVAVKRFPPAA